MKRALKVLLINGSHLKWVMSVIKGASCSFEEAVWIRRHTPSVTKLKLIVLTMFYFACMWRTLPPFLASKQCFPLRTARLFSRRKNEYPLIYLADIKMFNSFSKTTVNLFFNMPGKNTGIDNELESRWVTLKVFSKWVKEWLPWTSFS